MGFCHQCGTEVQPDDIFCSRCGEKQKTVRRKTQAAFGPGHDGRISAQGLRYKGVGIRCIAQLVDGMICLLILFIVGSTVAPLVGGTTPDGFEVSGTPAVFIQLLTTLLSILYFSFLEAYWNGQTLGKKITGIQVLKEDGTSIDLSTALIRNVLRIIDAFGFYLVAAISVWMSPRKQRIGDRVAKTCVAEKRVLPASTAR